MMNFLCFGNHLTRAVIKQTNNRLIEMFALFEIILFDPDPFSNNQTICQVQKVFHNLSEISTHIMA